MSSPVRITHIAVRSLCVAVMCLAAVALVAAPADADPLILPGASVSDHRARIEVSLAADSVRCRISLQGSRRYGPYAVRPGGPTRFVRWRLGRHASGDWRVRLSCREAARAGQRTRVTVERTVRFRRGGRPRGRLVAAGSVRVGPGSIPELAVERGRRRARPSSAEDVDTTVGQGDPTKFTACRDSRYVKSTRTIGDGIGTYLQIDPTDLAKSSGRSGDERDPFYTAIWNDVTRCAPLTAVPASQQHSMYVQLACHAKLEWTGRGGNTWDLEAWRQDKDWSAGLHPLRRCGQRYGDLGASEVGAFLDGRIVNSFPDDNPLQRAAWIVERQPLGFYLRRHIPTTQLYGCLIATGKAPARWYPQHFLNQYLRIGDPFTVGECTAPQPPRVVPPRPQPRPQPQPQATRQIVVDNRVTNGPTQMREDVPAYLSTVTRNFCKRDGCALAGTDMGSGAVIAAECTVLGDRTTNGQDNSSIDDGNPGLYSSTRWYGVRWGDGRFGYISEAWIRGDFRGGLGLRSC